MECIREIIYIFNNYFLNHIPFWPLRKAFYMLQGMKIGKGSRIMMGVKILAPRHIELGEHTYINEGCYLDGRGGINIGDNVTVAVFSKLITGGHNIDDDDFSYVSDAIKIGNNVAIFAGSMVVGGAIIERGCVFAASSVIKRGVYREKSLYAGNPAMVVRARKSESDYSQNTWHPIFR